MPFDFLPTEIKEVIEVRPKIFADQRGQFAELFKFDAFMQAGIKHAVSQINFARSKQNVLRGLHYQNPPQAQAKLVHCPFGEVFDVAVDIRHSSPTYGKWVGRTLSEQNRVMLYIPPGFAHGYCVLSDEADIVYSCDKQYAPEHEGGIIWNDPAIGIKWPLDKPILAERDEAYPPLADSKNTFAYV